MKKVLFVIVVMFAFRAYSDETKWKDNHNLQEIAIQTVYSFIRTLENNIRFTKEMNEVFFGFENGGPLELSLGEMVEAKSPQLFSVLQNYSLTGELIRSRRGLLLPVSIGKQKNAKNVVDIVAFASIISISWRSSLGYQPQKANVHPAGEQIRSYDFGDSKFCCVTVLVSTRDVDLFAKPKKTLVFIMPFNSATKRFYIDPNSILINGTNMLELMGLDYIKLLSQTEIAAVTDALKSVSEDNKTETNN